MSAGGLRSRTRTCQLRSLYRHMHTDRKNHIFVDFENGVNVDLDLIEGKPVHVTIVTGKHQSSLPKTLAKQFLRFSEQVSVIDNEQLGPNAADFVLAMEVGRKSINDPKGFYHIVSRDRGFDAVVKHLRSLNIMSARIEDFAAVPILVAADRLTLSQLADSYAARLQRRPVGRPARRAGLLAQIGVHFLKQIDEAKCEAIAKSLTEREVLRISDTGKVTYPPFDVSPVPPAPAKTTPEPAKKAVPASAKVPKKVQPVAVKTTRAAKTIAQLKNPTSTNRPGTLAKLRAKIKTDLSKDYSEAAVTRVIETLTIDGTLTIDALGRVAYSASPALNPS